MKILHVLSECYPLIKTGGLADYGYSLPHALKQLGADVRLLIPGYGDVLRAVRNERLIGEFEISMAGVSRHVRILEVLPPDYAVPVWLVDCPALFERSGNPYLDTDGTDWPDNAERFACFAKAGALLASGKYTGGWRADVVHCHDWQTGLLPAYLSQLPDPPRSIFTIHNLAYNGYFSHAEFQHLGLPREWWHTEGVEFYGGFSMLKAGIVFADAITTVSKAYADEILTAEFGHGMDGALRNFSYKLSGIVNGIDDHVWSPAVDPFLAGHYGIEDRSAGRAVNREALFRLLDWQPQQCASPYPLFGSIGRLVEQKGIDLLVTAASRILDHHAAAFIIIGDGQHEYIEQLMALQHTYPDQVRVFIGYSEELAHLVEAAADFFVMPSRYEPCGLNQLYSMRYGTPPVVRHVGGLADTVVDATVENLGNGTATGVVFQEPTADALHDALLRAIGLFNSPEHWLQIQRTAMQQDVGWHNSALQYLSLYSGVHDESTTHEGMRVSQAERIYSVRQAKKALPARQSRDAVRATGDEATVD